MLTFDHSEEEEIIEVGSSLDSTASLARIESYSATPSYQPSTSSESATALAIAELQNESSASGPSSRPNPDCL